MAGVVTVLDIPGGVNGVVKEFWAFLEGDDLESLIIHGQCIDSANVSYFILHGNSINILVSTCSFSWGGILVLGGMSLSLELPWDSGWSPWWGVACERQGDLDTCCLVFLSESVVWTHVCYFLDEWYHIAFESWGQVHASYWAWLIGIMDGRWLLVECMLD